MMEVHSFQKRKGIKFLLIIFLVVLLYLFANELEVNAAEGDTITGSTGSCTYTLTELSTGNYSLTISGSGAMYNYSWSGSVPWYKYRTQIEEINIEDGVTTIENYVFYGCELLENIEIPSSVTSIGNYAFYNCTSLTSIKIPSSITSIGNFAFYNCSSLISIEIPSSVTSIGRPVFSGCCSLTNISVDNENISYISQDGILYNKDMTELICFPAGKKDTSYTIPSTVTSIEWDAFYQCISLVEIDLSKCISLTNIGTGAFYSCTSLKEIDLSNCTELTSIGWTAFKYCTSLTEIDLSNCTLLTYIDSETFEQCISVVSVKLPRGITGIGGTAFASCYSLESIDLSNMVALEYMDSYAFANCTSLKSVDLSNCTKLSYIYGTFINCYNLETIDFEGDVSLSSIEYNAFYNCENLKQIDLSSCTSLTSIGWGAFEYCELLETIILPTSVKNINWYAFYHCSSLENIKLEDLESLTSIGKNAFYYCTSLKKIKLPSNVETIEDFAFEYCPLQNIDLSECTQLESIGKEAFYQMLDTADYVINMSLPKNSYFYAYEGALNCTYLNYSMIDSYAGYYYVDSDGVAWKYDTDSQEAYLAYIPSGIETYEIPSNITINEVKYTVVGINNLALFYANNLTEISFENVSNITMIDTYAFAYGNTLEKINGYTTIEEIKDSFENATLENTAIEATKISTTYNLYVEIDLTDYSSNMEEWIKSLVKTGDLTEITLQLYCNGKISKEQTINLDENTTNYLYTFENLSIENEYYVDIAHDNIGYGANILYGYTGKTIPTYAWINIGTKYAYTVTLDLDEEDSKGKISSVDINLLDEEKNVIGTATLSNENDWTYVFYIGYSNNRYYAYVYTSELYTVEVIENDNYDYNETINYEETSESENYENDTSCGNLTYSLYSYNPGATISLTYAQYSDLIVHHYIYDDNLEDPYTTYQVTSNDEGTVADEEYTGKVGEKYETQVSTDVDQYYEYVSRTDNWTGTYSEETTEVIYYYKLSSALVDRSLIKTATPETIETVDDEITYNISYDISINNYSGKATITLVDTLPHAIDEKLSDIDGGTYKETTDEKGNTTYTITWTEDVTVEDSYKDKIEKEIILVYIDVVETETIENVVNGKIETYYPDSYPIEELKGKIKDTFEDEDTAEVNQEYIISKKVVKTWNDNDNYKKHRPESVIITLYADGEIAKNYDGEEIKSITLSEENKWTYTFINLPKYNEKKEEINYTVVETETEEGDLDYYEEEIIYGTEYIEVKNSYRLTEADLESSIEKTGTESLTSLKGEVTYNITYTATISDYIGEVAITIVDTLPYAIEEDLSNIDGGIYELDTNTNTPTITWKETFKDVNTYKDGDYKIDITKTVTVVYGENLDITEGTITNKVTGTVELYELEQIKTVEDSQDTEVNIPPTVVVKYVDLETGEEIAEEVIIEGNVGDKYTTEQKEIEEYTYDSDTGNTEGIMTEDVIYVVYYYIQSEETDNNESNTNETNTNGTNTNESNNNEANTNETNTNETNTNDENKNNTNTLLNLNTENNTIEENSSTGKKDPDENLENTDTTLPGTGGQGTGNIIKVGVVIIIIGFIISKIEIVRINENANRDNGRGKVNTKNKNNKKN